MGIYTCKDHDMVIILIRRQMQNNIKDKSNVIFKKLSSRT